MKIQLYRYKSTIQAYKSIGKNDGMKGLWRGQYYHLNVIFIVFDINHFNINNLLFKSGTLPNIGRNAIINVAEIVCYDIVKDTILRRSLMQDAMPCHFVSAVIAGFCATVVASPVDVVKTRYMNSSKGQYKGAIDCAIRMGMQEGPSAFYKGYVFL